MLEKLKRYEEAVELLQFLVGQNLYLPDYHGHWYERYEFPPYLIFEKFCAVVCTV